MPPFDPENVRAAIPQVPSWGTERIKQVLQRARDKNISALVEACEEELQIRGPKSLSDREAADAREISRTLAGKRLEEVIELAFGYREADADEIRVIQWIAANPGTSYQETLAVYGKGDLSLVIGHLVYHRFGHLELTS